MYQPADTETPPLSFSDPPIQLISMHVKILPLPPA